MHYQFLIEDYSGSALIEEIMKRLVTDVYLNTYSCKSFRGIGGFKPKNTVKEIRTGKLLNDLAIYMRGFQRALQDIDAVLIIVLDNDKNDPVEFQNKLEAVAVKNGIVMDHVFCIAVEEMEAWLLGDEEAIKSAYPNMKAGVLHSYVQDSICGTWEVLAETVYKGGMKSIRNKRMSYKEIGTLKSEWARNIGKCMDFNHNKSPSFMHFLNSITSRLAV